MGSLGQAGMITTFFFTGKVKDLPATYNLVLDASGEENAYPYLTYRDKLWLARILYTQISSIKETTMVSLGDYDNEHDTFSVRVYLHHVPYGAAHIFHLVKEPIIYAYLRGRFDA